MVNNVKENEIKPSKPPDNSQIELLQLLVCWLLKALLE